MPGAKLAREADEREAIVYKPANETGEPRPAASSRSVTTAVCRLRRVVSGRVVAALVFAIMACGDDSVAPEPAAPDTGLSLVVVSGDQQRGRAGHDLADPLVVRVTDGRGRGVEAVPVTWTVEAGEGAFDGRFESLRCPPLGTARVYSDADGFARVSFTPTWFGRTSVAAAVPDARGSPVSFTTDASDPGAVITIVDGDHQEAKSGETLPSPMRVRVTDGNGNAVPHVSVSWSTDPTGGTLTDGCPWTASWNKAITTMRTLSGGEFDGLASMRFRPRDFIVGTSTVSAAVRGVASATTFTVQTITVVIAFVHDGWLNRIFFRSPGSVPVGTIVEFRNDVPANVLRTVRLISTSIPPGGEPFDSGELPPGERFAFVPRASGIWKFVDEVSGTTGFFIAR